MFRTGAPERGEQRAAPPAAVPKLVRAAWRGSGPGRPYDPLTTHERFLRETALPYGVPFRRDLFAAAPRHTSVALAAGALDALGPLTQAESPQVVVVAYATPDFEHGELVAAWLKHTLPGEPLSFAVSEQGVLAPFTALRIAVEYARRGGLRRAMVMVIDQSSQPYEGPAAGQHAVHRDGAAALLLEWPGGPAPVAGMAQGPLSGTRAVRAAPARCCSLVAGQGLAGPADVRTVLPEPETELPALPGLPCTGLWAALLAGRQGGDASGPKARGADPERTAEEPVGSERTAGEPVGSERTAGEPVGSERTAGEPVGSERTAGEPVGSERTAGEPVGSERTAEEPVVLADYDHELGLLAYCTLDVGELGPYAAVG